MMSSCNLSHNGSIEQIFYSPDIKTKLWGVKCETGLKYNQRVRKKYCITQAVLDPDSYKSADESKFVCVMVEHNAQEHIMAVLRHGELYQVSLNIPFDRENVTFFLKGTGTVNLLGYEILDPDLESSSCSSPPPEEVTRSKIKPSPSNIGKKKKTGPDDITTQNYRAKLLEMRDNDDDDDDEEDKDFSAGDGESEDTDSEDSENDENANPEDEASEVEGVEMEDKASENGEEESELREQVQKRKRMSAEGRSLKRSKMESSPGVSQKQFADTAIGDESSGMAPIPRKRKDKKKKKLDAKLDKAQQIIGSPMILKGGVEVRDLKIGRGPVATKGKLLHVFYVGRLANKEVFDSVLQGKRPLSFQLGAKAVIKGWDVGLEGMRAGGKRKIKIPPHMGYGSATFNGIPANSTLYFTVELQAVS